MVELNKIKMTLTKNQKLIFYIISKLSGSITKTKLVKLLYLMDLESFKRRGRILSNFEWFFYNHGPYPTGGFTDDIQTLSSNKLISETAFLTQDREREYYLYNSLSEIRDNPFDTDEEKMIANRIILDFGSYSLNRLLDHVYHTPPMDSTERRSKIDFSKVSFGIDPIESNLELEDESIDE